MLTFNIQYYVYIPSDRAMALGSTQPLTEMSTRSISWGKGCRFLRLTNLPPSLAVVMKSGNLNFLEPSGPLQACNGTALPLLLPSYHVHKFIYKIKKNPDYRTEVNACSNCNECLGLVKVTRLFKCLSFYRLFKKECIPWM